MPCHHAHHAGRVDGEDHHIIITEHQQHQHQLAHFRRILCGRASASPLLMVPVANLHNNCHTHNTLSTALSTPDYFSVGGRRAAACRGILNAARCSSEPHTPAISHARYDDAAAAGAAAGAMPWIKVVMCFFYLVCWYPIAQFRMVGVLFVGRCAAIE